MSVPLAEGKRGELWYSAGVEGLGPSWFLILTTYPHWVKLLYLTEGTIQKTTFSKDKLYLYWDAVKVEDG